MKINTDTKTFLKKLNDCFNLSSEFRTRISLLVQNNEEIKSGNKDVLTDELTKILSTSRLNPEQIQKYIDNVSGYIIPNIDNNNIENEIIPELYNDYYEEESFLLTPTSIKKYDVVFSYDCTFGGNRHKHYGVVYKVIDGLVYVVPITTKEIYGRIPMIKSRIFKKGYYVPSFNIIPEKKAITRFYCILDAKKEFDNTVEEIKRIIFHQLS